MSEVFSDRPILRLENVNLAASVGSNQILDDISFSLFPGDRLAIVGPSGAGKTSLLRLLNGLSEPTRGSIYFQNQDLSNLSKVKLRQQVVLLLQEPKLLGITVAQTLAYPLTLQKLPQREIQARIEKWITTLGIPSEWLSRKELQLSLGQRQLVAMARTLVMEPQILLLDEPTSALDIGRSSHLIEVLKALSSSGKIAIVMVNHQLDLAQQFSDRILYLHQGKLHQDTPAQNLDWEQLRQQIIQAEAQARQEWE